jgi:hypothetical protein
MQLKKLKEAKATRYEITYLGEIESYLGMRITREHSRKRTEIDQSSYLMGILNCS